MKMDETYFVRRHEAAILSPAIYLLVNHPMHISISEDEAPAPKCEDLAGGKRPLQMYQPQ